MQQSQSNQPAPPSPPSPQTPASKPTQPADPPPQKALDKAASLKEVPKQEQPKSERELEKSPKFRSYKLLYIVSLITVEIIIIGLSLLAFPWGAFTGEILPDGTPILFNWNWLFILTIGQIITVIVFFIIRKAYLYLTLGK